MKGKCFVFAPHPRASVCNFISVQLCVCVHLKVLLTERIKAGQRRKENSGGSLYEWDALK